MGASQGRCDGRRRSGWWARSALLLVVAALGLTLGAPGALAGDGDPDLAACVREQMADGLSRAQAVATCSIRTDPDRTTPTTAAPDNKVDEPAVVVDNNGSDDGGTSPLLVIGALVLGAAGGYAARALTSRGDAGRSGPAPAAAPVAAAPAPPAGDQQRGQLVAFLVDLRDRVGSQALGDEIGARLRETGVVEITVTPGEAFDPARHRGVEGVPTTDPSLDQRIASVERPGYADGGRPLRLPEVVVYRHQSGG